MAVVVFIRNKRQNYSSLEGVLKYVCQDRKTLLQKHLLNRDYTEIYSKKANDPFADDCIRLVSGKDCCPEIALQEFMTTKNVHGKTDGVFFFQYSQSFKDGENITPHQAHEIAMKFAEDNYKSYEVVVATHVDNEHIHSHFIINSVSFETGKKLHQGTDTLKKLRAYSDKLCSSYGLSVLNPYVKGQTQTVGSREYRSAVKGRSWKFRLASAIDQCMDICRTREEFIASMSSIGYEITWQENRKHITYLCPNGQRCRGDSLHEKKYAKGYMEHEFRIRAAQGAQQGKSFGFEQAIPTSRVRTAGGTVECNAETDERYCPVPTDCFGEAEPPAGQERHDGLPQSDTAVGAKNDAELLQIDSGADPTTGESITTGWESSRERLERNEQRKEQGQGFYCKQVSTTAVKANPPASDLVRIVGGAISLGVNLSQMMDTSSSQTKTHKGKRSIAEKEKRKALGQRDADSEETDWEQKM